MGQVQHAATVFPLRPQNFTTALYKLIHELTKGPIRKFEEATGQLYQPVSNTEEAEDHQVVGPCTQADRSDTGEHGRFVQFNILIYDLLTIYRG